MQKLQFVRNYLKIQKVFVDKHILFISVYQILMLPLVTINTVHTHNSDLFVRPKNMSLFWEISLFGVFDIESFISLQKQYEF